MRRAIALGMVAGLAACLLGCGSAPRGSQQVVTVDDEGTVLGVAVASSRGRCVVRISGVGTRVPRAEVPVAAATELRCLELGLVLTAPAELQGDLSGQTGTEFVVRRGDTGVWTLAARPPITAPGLDVYPDDPSRAVWNQLTTNTAGDLVAVGSPTCRRRLDDSGVLQGAVFRLRLLCDGRPVVLRSRTGASWTT